MPVRYIVDREYGPAYSRKAFDPAERHTSARLSAPGQSVAANVFLTTIKLGHQSH